MKKDYSKRNFINICGLSLPNLIGNIISLILSILVILIFNIDNELNMFLIIGLFQSFLGLNLSGRLLNKYCTNHDDTKCHDCKNWNCSRGK